MSPVVTGASALSRKAIYIDSDYFGSTTLGRVEPPAYRGLTPWEVIGIQELMPWPTYYLSAGSISVKA